MQNVDCPALAKAYPEKEGRMQAETAPERIILSQPFFATTAPGLQIPSCWHPSDRVFLNNQDRDP
jgi:hypothetical protein